MTHAQALFGWSEARAGLAPKCQGAMRIVGLAGGSRPMGAPAAAPVPQLEWHCCEACGTIVELYDGLPVNTFSEFPRRPPGPAATTELARSWEFPGHASEGVGSG